MTTALVTGGNRGIGKEICRQLAKRGMTVLLGARDRAAGDAAAAELAGEGFDVCAVEIDVGSDTSVAACAEALNKDGVEIDVLVNNAGIIADGDLLSGPTTPMSEGLEVNLLGAYRTARAFVPGMIARGQGRVVNVSSNWGSFDAGLEGPPAYAISKAALNALTVRLAREAGDKVKVNCLCPGWVRTRMGGEGADSSVEEGADTAIFLATLPDDGPTGQFFRKRQPHAW